MSITNNYLPVKQSGNGVTTNFSGNWNVIAASYIRVYWEDKTTGVQTLKTKDTHYTLDFDQDGFIVTFEPSFIPSSDVWVVIGRQVSLDQTVPYTTSQGFQGAATENSFDKLTAMVQDSQDQLNRAPKVPLGSLVELTIDEIPEAGKALIGNAAGDGYENGPDASDIANAQSNAAIATAQAIIATEQAALATAAAAGMKLKASVKAASTGNLTLSGAQTVDGIALIAGDRVLVKDQSTGSQNGIYVVAASAWTRSTDANTWDQLVSAMVTVEEGTVNADATYVCTVNQGGTIGVTSVTWSPLITAVPDGSLSYAKMAASAFASASDILNSVASKIVNAVTLKSFLDTYKITLAGTIATTSGTNIDFPSIPSWVKRITIGLVEVSTNGTNSYSIQMGVGGTPEATNYKGTYSNFSISTVNTLQNSTSFGIPVASASALVNGKIELFLADAATNTWVCDISCSQSNTTTGFICSGSKALAGVLDMVRLSAGGNTFDGGFATYAYE